jgi:hypothetical protein
MKDKRVEGMQILSAADAERLLARATEYGWDTR